MALVSSVFRDESSRAVQNRLELGRLVARRSAHRLQQNFSCNWDESRGARNVEGSDWRDIQEKPLRTWQLIRNLL